MLSSVWSESIYVPLLQQLVRGPLKQNLPQAGRLWVWLQLLYGEQLLSLPRTFTYADCREALFTSTHPRGDRTPAKHDAQCPCQKSLVAWLFLPQMNGTQKQWLAHKHQAQQEIEKFRVDLAKVGAFPNSSASLLASLLHESRPFEVSRRTLASDLKRLCELGWLQQASEGYQKVADWPDYPSAPANELTFLVQPDLAGIAENLAQEIGGQQRFFVHTDYVVPQDSHDRVEDWQDELRSHWQQSSPSPIQLTYWSASRLERYEVVVYPVCIYYYRRGPYLCAWGQVPGQMPGQSENLDWRNYRLDRIEAIAPISWQAAAVPAELKQRQIAHTLPHPDEIALRMAEAWGFDYYQPVKQMLVRFDAEWDRRYIRNSLRHLTFERVSQQQGRSLIQTTLAPDQAAQMLAALATRPEHSAYYKALYRHNDPNVRQRLRAWRPHIEVILPWSLRQRFAREVAEEQQFYQSLT